jgi:hypothetical protein
MPITLALTAGCWRQVLPAIPLDALGYRTALAARIAAAVDPYPNHQAVPISLTYPEWRVVQRARHALR